MAETTAIRSFESHWRKMLHAENSVWRAIYDTVDMYSIKVRITLYMFIVDLL